MHQDSYQLSVKKLTVTSKEVFSFTVNCSLETVSLTAIKGENHVD